MEGKNVLEYKFPEKSAIVLGSESHGISNKVIRLLDDQLTIPKKGEAESLNVSVAAGIFCSRMQIS